jgi:hypothetical protein
MPALDKSVNATQSFFELVSFPQSYLGILVVVWTMTIHMLLVGAIAVLFVSRTRSTLLGQAWSNIAQLYSPELQTVLRESRLASDVEVRKLLEAQGMAELVARIARHNSEGTVGLVLSRVRTWSSELEAEQRGDKVLE